MRSPVEFHSVSRIPISPRSRRTGQELLKDYLAGPENALLAHVANTSESIVERGNPWLLIGPTGVGKTALAKFFAAREAAIREPVGRVLFETATDFGRRYAEAIDADDLEHFRVRYDRPEVVVIDDVQDLASKAAAQDELAIRIDTRIKKFRATITICRTLPIHVRGLRPGLASRLLPGLTLPISPPEKETRLAVLRDLSESLTLDFDDAQLVLIDRQLPDRIPVRRFAAALQHIALQRSTGVGESLAVEIDQAVRSAGVPSISSITNLVSKRFKLKVSDLKSDSRSQRTVLARSLAMYLSRELTDQSLQKIGHYFGGRDHSTVLHALKKTSASLESQRDFAQIATELVDQLRGG